MSRPVERRRSLRLGFALRLAWDSGPAWTLASGALVLVQGVLPLVTLYLLKLIVDGVAASLTGPARSVAVDHLFVLIALAAAATLASALSQSVAGLVGDVYSQVVTDHVYDILHTKSVDVDLAYYEDARYFDTLHRAQQEAAFRPARVVHGLLHVGQSVVTLVAMAGLLATFHVGATVLLFVSALPGLALRVRYAGQIYRWQRERTPMERRAEYVGWMLTDSWPAKEIRMFGLGPLLLGRFRTLRARLREDRLRFARKRALSELISQTALTAAAFGAFSVMIVRALRGAITLGDLVMYYQTFQRGQRALHGILGGLAGLYEDNLFLAHLQEFLDLQRTITDPRTPTPMPVRMQTGIVFDRVSFRYPNCADDVLKDVVLTVRPGEVVALVGENGAGKTTLIKLLCRLYDPTRGTITLDGIDLRHFDPAALRRSVAVIFQDYVHYQLTARENIWFGNVDLPPDSERIDAAARHAGAAQVIRALRGGYETMLGRWFDGGEELSVGQWQKIALARAFVRDAQVIVLDEPTSDLDPRAEHEVFSTFRELLDGRTGILISHRLSTTKMADRIYVLDEGAIVECGTHDELMRRRGAYARLFDLQAQQYR